MSYINDIVIPGVEGRVFTTDVKKEEELQQLQEALRTIGGVTEVTYNSTVFPTEITIKAETVVGVKEVEEKTNELGFHILPKTSF